VTGTAIIKTALDLIVSLKIYHERLSGILEPFSGILLSFILTQKLSRFVAALQRGSFIISVIGRGLLLKEEEMKDKAYAVIFIFIGVAVLHVFGG